MQEGVTVEVLLDSRTMELIMSSKFARKQGFKLKRLERLMNVRNVDRSLEQGGAHKAYCGSQYLLSRI